ncbi:MAG: hypothetical protein QGI75_07775 [Phycisphaerales bacterium]|jgi:hypothetical protein|nr:hypothetical protein [Phycisphaerales bacterium]
MPMQLVIDKRLIPFPVRPRSANPVYGVFLILVFAGGMFLIPMGSLYLLSDVFGAPLAYSTGAIIAGMGGFLLVAILWKRRWRRRARRASFLLCLDCGYRLTQVPPEGLCPECGAMYTHVCCEWGWRKFDGLVPVSPTPPELPPDS